MGWNLHNNNELCTILLCNNDSVVYWVFTGTVMVVTLTTVCTYMCYCNLRFVTVLSFLTVTIPYLIPYSTTRTVFKKIKEDFFVNFVQNVLTVRISGTVPILVRYSNFTYGSNIFRVELYATVVYGTVGTVQCLCQ